MSALDKIKPLLENGKSARFAELTDEEKNAVYDLHLITMKPQLYVCNVDEEGIKNGNQYIEAVKKSPLPKNTRTEAVPTLSLFAANSKRNLPVLKAKKNAKSF